MSDQAALWTWVHRANIERYRRMMATPLTAVERRLIEQRIGEEEAALRRTLESIDPPDPADDQG